MAVALSYGSSRSGGVTGACFRSRRVGICLAFLIRAVAALSFGMGWDAPANAGTESTPPPPPSQSQQTNSLEAVAYLQLQEALHATQLAIEQNRQEAKVAAAQAAEALTKGLQTIQEALASQRAQEFAAMQQSNRIVFIVAGTLAGMGFLSLLLVTYFQWRMSKGLADISAALSTALGLEPETGLPALGPPESSHLQLQHPAMAQGNRAPQALNPPPAVHRPRTRAGPPVEWRFFPNPSDFFRRRQLRTLKMALLVGLVCALAVALLLYLDYLRRSH